MEIDRYLDTVRFAPAVVGYLRDENRVCLGVRKTSSSDLGVQLVAGIGGKVGDTPEIAGETRPQAMDRETMEEIGVTVVDKQEMGRARFMFTHKSPDSSWQQDVTIYSISKWTGEPTETDSTQPLWFQTTEIPWERMWADNELWLPKVLAGEKVDAIFLFGGDNELIEYRFEEIK